MTTHLSPVEEALKRFGEFWIEKSGFESDIDYDTLVSFIRQELLRFQRQTREELIEGVEKISKRYTDKRPSYGIDNRTILNRRWEVLKIIIRGIHTKEENEVALKYIEEFMDISDKNRSDKDNYLLEKLADVIEKFESVTYPNLSKLTQPKEDKL